MAKTIRNQYQPNTVSAPGETLLETIEALGLTQAALAERTGRPLKTINEIIKGKAAITPETALQFERVLGVPAHFWNNREAQYRESLARQEELQRLMQHVAWLDQFPLREMIRLGWVEQATDKVRQVQVLLNYFGVASPERWHELWTRPDVAFRKSLTFESDIGATSAWLRKGELDAARVECEPFDASAFIEALEAVRRLTIKPPEAFVPEMQALCARAGVAVVFVPELPRMRANGACRWMTPYKALIQLSLRYKTDDHLWFAFFHEGGHILKHGKKDFFIEDEQYGRDPKEEEANRFAEEVLIPRKQLNDFMARGRKSREAVEGFARELGIAPGIVVGRLKYEGYLPQTHLNDLRRKLAWVSV
ncbi:MAG: HigA family addiction module antitoxin [Chloroflexi bacterium]|nr:HigA family addiction module antitoxin [Chloroflexota bacterium]